MKKILLFAIFCVVVVYSAMYLVQSGFLFVDGIKNLSGKQNLAAGIAFADLATHYPNSPFMGVSRLAAVLKDPKYLTYMDLYYQAKTEKDLFQIFVGRTPAYYDPFLFVSLVYYLLLTFLGIAQRYWAGSKGLDLRVLFSRDTFAFIIGLLYVLWVRGSANPESVVMRMADGIHHIFTQPVGITAVTVCFSAFMVLVNIVITLIAFAGFRGKAKTS